MSDADRQWTPERTVWEQLRQQVYGDSPGAGRTEDGKSRWAHAPLHLRRYAAQYALEASVLGELLEDPEFLVHADTETLADALAQSRGTSSARGTETTYQASYPAHRATEPDARRQILLIDAARLGQSDLATSLHHDGARAVRWATGSGRSASLRHCLMPPESVGPPAATEVRASGVVAGRPMAVAIYRGYHGANAPESVVWDLESGRMAASLRRTDAGRGETEPTCATIAEVDDGTLVVIGYDDGTVQAWDILTGQHRDHYGFDAHPAGRDQVAGVTALTFVPTGQGPRLVSGGRDGALRVWDARRPAANGPLHSHEQAHLGGVSTLAVAPDVRDPTARPSEWVQPTSTGVQRVLSGGEEGLVRSWYLAADDSIAPQAKWAGPPERVASLGLGMASPGEEPVCLTGCQDGTLTLRETETGLEATQIRTDTDGIADLVMLHHRPYGVTGSQEGVVTVWDLYSGKALRRLAGHGEGLTTVAVIALAGRPHVVTGSADGAVRVWDLEPPPEGDHAVRRGNPSRLQAVSLSPGGELVAAMGHDGTVVVRHVNDGSLSQSPVRVPYTPTRAVGLGWLPGEGPLVARASEHFLEVHGPLTAEVDQDGHPLHEPAHIPPWTLPLPYLDAVAVRGQGGAALVATSRPDHPVEFWFPGKSTPVGAAPRNLLSDGDRLRALALGAPGEHLVAGITQQGTVALWSHARDWTMHFSYPLSGATAVAIGYVHAGLPDPVPCLAVGLDFGAVAFWLLRGRDENVSVEGQMELIRCPDPVRALAMAPDGSILVAQGPDLVTLDAS